MGIVFDTVKMTWKLPRRKIVVFVKQLVEASAESGRLTLTRWKLSLVNSHT